MNKTVVSMALLKATYTYAKKNYLESFIPFVMSLIYEKPDVDINDVHVICTAFNNEWGFHVPYHPMKSILNYAVKSGFIKREYGKYIINEKKVLELNFRKTSEEQQRKANKVIREFIIFCDDRYDLSISNEDAETAILSFLQDHDLEILCASERKTILPEVRGTAKLKYLIHSFIKNAHEGEPEIFTFIVDIAVGHMIASTLLYDKVSRMKGKLKKVTFYLDTGIILALLGVNGNEMCDVSRIFIKSLKDEGSAIGVLRYNYDETLTLLENSRAWIDNINYDPARASKTLRNLRRQNYNVSDVDRLTIALDGILAKNSIEIVEPPNPDDHKDFQIDEKNLEETIVNLYKQGNPDFNEIEKKITLRNDINSISAVYRLRKEYKTKKIGDAKFIFISPNSTLAYATNIFQKAIYGNEFTIPPCLTDVFVGTFVWLQNPLTITALQKKKIIADCFAAMQPTEQLLRIFVSEINKLHHNGNIADDEYYLLRTHQYAYDLLQEKTQGDIGNFSPKTIEEIHRELLNRIRNEEGKKYIKEKGEHDKTKQERDTAIQEKKDVFRDAYNLSDKASGYIFLIGVVFGVLLLILLILNQFFNNFLHLPKILEILLLVILAIFTFLNLFAGFNLLNFGKRLRAFIHSYISKRLSIYLNRKQ